MPCSTTATTRPAKLRRCARWAYHHMNPSQPATRSKKSGLEASTRRGSWPTSRSLSTQRSEDDWYRPLVSNWLSGWIAILSNSGPQSSSRGA
jgi:hypothetical protein